MAGSDSDDLEDMLLEAGGAGRPSNKRSRDEDVSDASQQDGDSQLSEEVSQEYQAPAKKAKALGKKRKTATGSDAADKEDTFDEDAFVFDGYGKDLIRGSADQAELDKLTEFERENELFQRAEARDREIERRRHAKLLQQSRAQQATAQPQVLALHKALSACVCCSLLLNCDSSVLCMCACVGPMSVRVHYKCMLKIFHQNACTKLSFMIAFVTADCSRQS